MRRPECRWDDVVASSSYVRSSGAAFSSSSVAS